MSMGLEIERKFLVHHELLPPLSAGERIIQGYLSKKPMVRFRIINHDLIITVKEYFSVGRRFELETPAKKVTEEEIAKIQELAISPPIIKVRHKIKDESGLIWELDIYEGPNKGLMTVDIELPAEDYPIRFPAWVDHEHEITEDEHYNNLNLSRKPYSTWT